MLSRYKEWQVLYKLISSKLSLVMTLVSCVFVGVDSEPCRGYLAILVEAYKWT